MFGFAARPPRSKRSLNLQKALVRALRVAVLPTLALPFALGAFGAAMTGAGPSPKVITLILVSVTAAMAACWARVLVRWRDQRRADDDDGQWRHDRDDDDPCAPDGDSAGPAIDWIAFDRDFAAYAHACASDRAHQVLAESRAVA
jgi:hypothetical protein